MKITKDFAQFTIFSFFFTSFAYSYQAFDDDSHGYSQRVQVEVNGKESYYIAFDDFGSDWYNLTQPTDITQARIVFSYMPYDRMPGPMKCLFWSPSKTNYISEIFGTDQPLRLREPFAAAEQFMCFHIWDIQLKSSAILFAEDEIGEKRIFWTDAKEANGNGVGRTLGGAYTVEKIKVVEVPHPNTLCLVHMEAKTAVLRVGEDSTKNYGRQLFYVFCFYEERS